MASPDQLKRRPDGEQKLAPPVVSLPKGGGAIRGMGDKFAANPVTGTGAMSVSIALSPARSGFAPQLSLNYDSGSGNGPFGFGWSLSLPTITRKTDKGLPQYRDHDESDVYVLSDAEDLVPVLRQNGKRFEDDTSFPGYVIHRYRPRVDGLFARIERWTKVATQEIHWRSISRDNVTSLYGKDNNSRIFDPEDSFPANPTRVFTWLICESHDDKGNAITYEYARESEDNVDRGQASERNRVRTANRYNKRIKYGNRVSRLVQPNLSQAVRSSLRLRRGPLPGFKFKESDGMKAAVKDEALGSYRYRLTQVPSLPVGPLNLTFDNNSMKNLWLLVRLHWRGHFGELRDGNHKAKCKE